MAEEEFVAAASPAPSDHKRKHEDLELEAPEPLMADSNANAKTNENVNESDSIKRAEEEGEEKEEEEEEETVEGRDSGESEAKRPRLEENANGLAIENGFQEEKVDELVEEDAEQPFAKNNTDSEDTHHPAEGAPETVNNEQPSTDDHQKGDIQPPSIANPQLENAQQQSSGGELQEPSAEVPQQGDFSSVEQQPASETQTMSRKMEVPNNKVGVLIGKAGDTIRFLQINSGAKIQITRDGEADPYSANRPVELIGTLENINKAEKLIKDVIDEADAGGSPALVARGFSTVQAAGAAEQILMQVPNEKVGVIIGKGGETIKSLQTRSGARIQLIPQHLPEGDQSKERTVRVSGDKKQIEMAREMIKEVMNQPVRPSPLSGGQQGFRPRGPAAPPQWGPRGPHHAQPTGYDYQQRGPYPSQNSQYPPQSYGNYRPQQGASRNSFGPGWEPRPPATMQGPPPQSGGYDYYGGQGHMVDASSSVPLSNPVHGPGPSPAPMGPPPSQGNYNYRQPHGPEYQPAPYSQAAPPQQSYGHGYNETKYENQPPSHHSYGGDSQSGGYSQGTHPGYAQQDQYGKAPSYGMPPHGPPSQVYGQPRATQPGDMPYQGPTQPPYGQSAPPQQTYPYASSGPTQQTYQPPYGSAPVTDGYNQLPPATVSAYPQQGGQPVTGYTQPGGQQALGYAQMGPTGGYGSYPSSQPVGYTEQPPTQNNAGYGGYQGAAADPAYGSAPGSAYYGAPPTGQAGYAQPASTQQPGYDQSVPHSGSGYGSSGVPVAGGAPVGGGYGKSLSPQPGYPPQYDSSAQIYGGAYR